MPKDGEIEKIDELAGYVNRERAMATMGINSPGYLWQLVQAGTIKVVRWDDRTLLYDKRSVEKFKRERSPRKAKPDEASK
jgi:hypothetical protein